MQRASAAEKSQIIQKDSFDFECITSYDEPSMPRHLTIAVLVAAVVVLGSASWAYWPPPEQSLRHRIDALKKQAQTEAGRERGVEGLEAIIGDETITESVRALAIVALGDVGDSSVEEFLTGLARIRHRSGWDRRREPFCWHRGGLAVGG